MKCPKCGYLGFESVERCRNCGYDFSLSVASHTPDLSIRTSTPDGPLALADLALGENGLRVSASPGSRSAAAVDFDAAAVSTTSTGPTPELPLFGSAIPDDVPLITRVSPPRTPLAVRRATPEVPRLRAEPRSVMLDLAAPEIEPRRSPIPLSFETADVRGADVESESPAASEPAGVVARMIAAALDLLVLAGTDALVVYLTLEICGLTIHDLALIPRAPMIAFLLVQNIGYFVAFTAGGQTLGQMATGVKVVADEGQRAPDFAHAAVRTVVWAVLLIPAGLGLVTTLFSHDRRGLHDRCAGTRVVRAGA